MALKIINEGIKSGSKNSKIISKLIDRGAILIQTEDFGMVKDEYDGFQSILKSKNKITKLFRLFRYKILKTIFLTRRDKFISARIAETLEQSETGILFIGAYHNIIKRLPKDIKVIEMKEIAKVRKYQKIIQSNAKIKKIQFEQLTKYLIEK
jgi:pheromone shutdown protein TraB